MNWKKLYLDYFKLPFFLSLLIKLVLIYFILGYVPFRYIKYSGDYLAEIYTGLGFSLFMIPLVDVPFISLLAYRQIKNRSHNGITKSLVMGILGGIIVFAITLFLTLLIALTISFFQIPISLGEV